MNRMKEKTVRVYLDLFWITTMRCSKGIELTLHGATKKGEGQHYVIVLTFSLSFIPNFITGFKKILDEKIAEITSYRNFIK